MELNDITDKEVDLKPLDKTLFLKENESISSTTYRNIIKSTAIVVIYSAAAVASSTSLLFIPNLETITIFIFLVSFYYGFKIGLSMMLTTATIFELFASIVYGFAGPLFFFKIFAYFINVLVASNLSKVMIENIPASSVSDLKIKFSSRLGFMIVGIVLTLIFDLITTFYSFFLVQNVRAFVLLFIAGLPYTFFHEFTNGVIFFFVPDYLGVIKISNNISLFGSE